MARPKPLAELVKPCLGEALAARGFAAADVIVAWPEMVGERLARVSQPARIEWPRGERRDHDVLAGPEDRGRHRGATLVVRIEGAYALELQHLAPLVIERINARYGWRFVERLALRQGPVRRRLAKEVKPEAPLSALDQGRVEAATESVGDEALRAALDRLGRAVLARSAREES